MRPDDRAAFFEAWETMVELLAGKALSDRALRFAFDLLAEYELHEIIQALRIHCLQSPYTPKPCNIRAIIAGSVPDNVEVFGLAQSADTMLGAYVRYLIGEHDLMRLPARDATARVASQRTKIKLFVERAQSGMMTDDEIRLLGGKGFDVTSELCHGLSGARIVYHARLRERQAELVKTQIDVSEPEPEFIEADAEAVKRRISELMASLKTTNFKGRSAASSMISAGENR